MGPKPVHWTDLKRIGISPAHYLAGLENQKDTPAMAFGRLVHQLVLGGPPSAVWDGERRGKAWEAFRDANQDREIVTAKEVERARRVADALGRDTVARPYLAGRTEYPVTWRVLGRECATRGIDILGDEADDFLADLKTSTCVEPEAFRRQILRLGYHAQLAWYLDAAASIGQPRTRAYIIGVEVAPPYAVTVVHVGPKTLEQGRRLNRLWMERLLACEAVNEWPGYTQSVVELDMDADDYGLIIDGDDEEVAA